MSVRDKYRSTFNELQRAESIPERISVFRRVWAWIIIASQKVVARFGFIVIPLYLIVLSILNFNECEGIPVLILAIGILMLICTLYPPFYAYGKKKALEDRQDRINHHQTPLHEGEIETEEVNKFIPCRMHRICNASFSFILGVAPILTYHTFRMFFSHDQCSFLMYWTAFCICFIYSTWVLFLILACFLCCCFVTLPQCMSKCNGNNSEDVETGND
uniref:Transmembrane protein n=1 Tax=Caenorhabditis tropicalis TaxID=1561998 RepID=A0A1I7T345_9PELO